jgi:hypothetical protein
MGAAPERTALPAEAASCACDVLVLGSGAGGLSAALAAASRGLQTIVAEKAETIGGTSIWSGGWVWVPCNPLAERDGVEDSLDNARLYLQGRLGNQYDGALVDAYLEAGPRMVAEYMRDTAVQLESGGYIFPDYHPETPGSLHGSGQSRSLRTVSFDARNLSRATLCGRCCRSSRYSECCSARWSRCSTSSTRRARSPRPGSWRASSCAMPGIAPCTGATCRSSTAWR